MLKLGVKGKWLTKNKGLYCSRQHAMGLVSVKLCTVWNRQKHLSVSLFLMIQTESTAGQIETS